jgi:hypothetical protein
MNDRTTIIARDLAAADNALKRMCANIVYRRIVLSQLLDSVEIANRLAPESWAVTQFQGGFRLNVGPVEAFACIDGECRLLLACAAGESGMWGVEAIRYRSLPEPQAVFVGTPEQFADGRSRLHEQHAKYVELAALGQDGRPRRCTYARFNSPAVLECAKREQAQTFDVR